MESSHCMLRQLSERAFGYSPCLNGRVCRSLGRHRLRGGFASVYHGTLFPEGSEVAIKTLHPALSDTEDGFKRLFREVHTWSKLRHENIVPMLGFSTDFDSTVSIISEWMPLGNAHDYVQNTEHDPRPLLEGLANGLCYLHGHELGPVVHGGPKGLDVMVSTDRRALLTDFGLSTLHISTFSMTVDPIWGMPLHWTAPELLGGDHASMASDVWAFGMTVLELFTRSAPFSDCSPSSVIARITSGKLPPRPVAESTHFRMTDAWWEICTSCWGDDPSSRPIMKDVIEKVKVAMYPTGATSLPPRTPPVEQDCYFPDSSHHQSVTEQSSMLGELCDRAHEYGISLNSRIDRTPGRNPFRGGNATVYHGTLIPDGTEVAIKTFHNAMWGSDTEIKRIFREVHVWSKLRHENVVRMLGISTEFYSTLSVISEWMPLGNAHTYVKNTENDPRPLIKDIASGLCYLHSYAAPTGPIIHGDLKGVNVMVSGDRRALLTDFGLSTLNTSTFNMTVETIHGYSPHWTAPELLDSCLPSTASDVWAFGMTILELFTRAAPFHDCSNFGQIFTRLIKGMLPHRPAPESTQSRLTDAWWEICLSCRESDLSLRPTIRDILEKIEASISQASSAAMRPGASGSARPISKEGGNHPTPESPSFAGSDTATGQTSESIALVRTAPEYPNPTADASKSPFSTEFFTCPIAQLSLMYDLNDKFAPPTSVTVDESGSADSVARSNVEDAPLPTSSANNFRPVGFESLMSQSQSASEDKSRGADILAANGKDVESIESDGSQECSGKGNGSTHNGVTQPERKRVAEEITEDFRGEYPEPMTQLELYAGVEVTQRSPERTHTSGTET
ncbi:kinase-like domain-containing protein [Pisolithus albus]|nr:kinase-like domain-containing protein [Pisolithus albus]